MKKIFTGVVIFAIVSVLVTGALINIKNKRINADDALSGDKPSGVTDDETENISEKTIDLNGTYNENDLIIEEKIVETLKVDGEDAEIKIPQINGLKNKTVENKVNTDIRNRISEIIGKFASNSEVKNVNSYYDMTGNFSNVISGLWHISYEDTSKHEEEVYINYELVNGKRLKLEDFFIKDMDFNTLIRKMVYKEIARGAHEGEMYSGMYYDKEKQAWMMEYFGELGMNGVFERFVEAAPLRTEEYLNKVMKRFMKEKEKDFYFSPTKICIKLDDEGYYNYIYKNAYYYYLKDIANEVTIYDKYLTNESIYESQNIGAKDIWTCCESAGKDVKCGFAAENLYYEIYYSNYWPYVYYEKYENLIEKVRNKTIKAAQEKVEEYKKIASDNPEKFHIVYLRCELDFDDDLYMKIDSDEELTKSEKTVLAKTTEYITTTGITNKKKVMDYLLDCYRYYNVDFYPSAMYYAGFDRDKTSDEERGELSYILDGINDKFIYDTFEEKEYTQMYNLDMIIISDSSTRKLEKSEIQDLTSDELNKAYNEIFARHGHEFKNTELREYFEMCPWYTPISGKTVTLEELTEIERYNIEIIKSVINDKKAENS